MIWLQSLSIHTACRGVASILFISLLASDLLSANAAALRLDSSFAPKLTASESNNSSLTGFAVAPDGKIYISGEFDYVNGVPKTGLIRLHADGTIDSSFRYKAPHTGAVPLIVRNDGDILVQSSTHQGWIHSDGTLGGALEVYPVCHNGGSLRNAVLLGTGDILIGGDFCSLNGVNQNGLARLTADGALDRTFVPPSIPWLVAPQFELLPDERIMLSAGRTSDLPLVRILSSGQTDPSFQFAPELITHVTTFAAQADGRVVVGGSFQLSNKQSNVARLNLDGSIDPNFHAPSPNAPVLSAIITPENKILIYGSFTRVGELPRPGFARLNEDGSIDSTFQPQRISPVFTESREARIVPLPGGKVLVQQRLGELSQARSKLIQLEADGSPDKTFTLELELNAGLSRVLLQADGKLIVRGFFDHVNGVAHSGTVRLHPEGSVDTTFNPPLGFLPFLIEPAGTVLGNVNGRGLTRLTETGDQDPTFVVPASLLGASMSEITVDRGSRILVGISKPRAQPNVTTGADAVVVRLQPNGDLDGSFHSEFLMGSHIDAIAALDNGQILVAGTLLKGNQSFPVARLDENGRIDPDFSLPIPQGSYGRTVKRQKDGQILAEFMDQMGRNTLVRLSKDGRLDGVIQMDSARLMSVDDGKLLVANRGLLFRLNPDFSLDNTFGMSPYFINGSIRNVTDAIRAEDGAYFMIGEFEIGPEATRRNLVKLLPTSEPVPPLIRNLGRTLDGHFQFQLWMPAEYPFRVEMAPTIDPFIWGSFRQAVTTGIATGDWMTIVDPNASTDASRFYGVVLP